MPRQKTHRIDGQHQRVNVRVYNDGSAYVQRACDGAEAWLPARLLPADRQAAIEAAAHVLDVPVDVPRKVSLRRKLRRTAAVAA